MAPRCATSRDLQRQVHNNDKPLVYVDHAADHFPCNKSVAKSRQRPSECPKPIQPLGFRAPKRSGALNMMRPLANEYARTRTNRAIRTHAQRGSTAKTTTQNNYKGGIGCHLARGFSGAAGLPDATNSRLTAVGFEPTPFRNGALSHHLRPLGQTVMM